MNNMEVHVQGFGPIVAFRGASFLVSGYVHRFSSVNYRAQGGRTSI